MAKTIKINNNDFKIEREDLRWTINSNFMKPNWINRNIQTTVITSKVPLTDKVLEEIVRSIIDENPNVKFEEIMYDSNTKVVLFIIKNNTKAIINTKNCYDYIECVTSELSFKNIDEIIREFNDNSNSKIDDVDAISAYDAINYFYNIIYNYKSNQKKYLTKINSDIKNKCNVPDDLKAIAKKIEVTEIRYDGDSAFGNNQVFVSTFIDGAKIDIVIFNDEGETQIKFLQPGCAKEKNIIGIISNNLNEFINNIKPYINLQNEEKSLVLKSINSKLITTIHKNIGFYDKLSDISAIINNKQEVLFSHFVKENSYKEKIIPYKYDTSYYNLITYIFNNEANILQNIYIKIEDFPIWTQEDLKAIRKETLDKKEKNQSLEKRKINIKKKIKNIFNK